MCCNWILQCQRLSSQAILERERYRLSSRENSPESVNSAIFPEELRGFLVTIVNDYGFDQPLFSKLDCNPFTCALTRSAFHPGRTLIRRKQIIDAILYAELRRPDRTCAVLL